MHTLTILDTEDLHGINESLSNLLRELKALREEIRPKNDRPLQTWERRSDAVKTRRVSISTLNKAVADGRVRCKRVPGRGGEHILLSVADLDGCFPLRAASR